MNLWFDLKYAWRLSRKSWGHSLICVTVVALSVGLSVWTGTLIYSQAFKPLGFAGSERWYSIQLAPNANARPRPTFDAYTYQELLKHTRNGEHLGAFTVRPLVLSEGEATLGLRGAAITPRLLRASSVAPVLGRVFDDRDGLAEAAPVAILGFDAWQQYFAADPEIVGKTARIDSAPVQIIGVMPREFIQFEDAEVWLPLQMPKMARPQDSTLTMFPYIAVREGQDLNALRSELKTIVERVNGDHPQIFAAARTTALIPAHRIFSHGVMPIMAMMGLMAAGVLLIGCMNISMVFLARLLERSRELALRTALGASRPRLLRQCLLETALVVFAGLAGGYVLAFLGVKWTEGIGGFMDRVLATGRSSNMPTLRPFDIGVAILAAIVVWLLSTLIPAWRVAKQDAAVVLGGSGKGANVRASNRSVGILVGLQVVVSCLVLVMAGNVVLAVRKETSKPSGMNSKNVVHSTYATNFDSRFADPSLRLRYWEDLAASIAKRVPGARVAYTTASPTRPARVPATIETRQGGEKDGALTLPATTVSENYFQLLGIGLRSGRLFDSTDNASSLPVAIVDEKMAQRYWPEQNVLGKRVRLNTGGTESWLTIVGVVSSVPGSPYRPDADVGALYQPLKQVVPQSFQVLVQLPNAGIDFRAALRPAAYAVDRDLPLHNLQTLDDYIQATKLGSSAMIPVFLVIALITAVLAASGLFGLISRSVAQRTQEVGIRRALGATKFRATSMFLRQGAIYLSVAVVGLVLGIIVMPMLSRAIPNILDHAVAVTSIVVLLMAAVISTASYVPTRRAVALEPGDALRYE
jgi:putative ABC transport system permease protein